MSISQNESDESNSSNRLKKQRKIPSDVPTTVRGRSVSSQQDQESLTAAEERQLQKEWWLRVPLAILSPRAVFTALRNERRSVLSARQEPVLLLMLLSGIAAVLQTSSAGSLLNNPEIDGALIFVWAIIGGLIYGAVSYWFGGLAIYLGARGASVKGQSKPSYQRARHVIAFAAAPLALSLVLWPFQIALYGLESFRDDGRESLGEQIFSALGLVFVIWSGVLLLYGIRTTYDWTWLRAVGTVLLGVLALLCVAAPFYLV